MIIAILEGCDRYGVTGVTTEGAQRGAQGTVDQCQYGRWVNNGCRDGCSRLGFSLRLCPLVGCNLHLKSRVEKRQGVSHVIGVCEVLWNLFQLYDSLLTDECISRYGLWSKFKSHCSREMWEWGWREGNGYKRYLGGEQMWILKCCYPCELSYRGEDALTNPFHYFCPLDVFHCVLIHWHSGLLEMAELWGILLNVVNATESLLYLVVLSLKS